MSVKIAGTIFVGALVLVGIIIVLQQRDVGKTATVIGSNPPVRVTIVAVDTRTAPNTYIVRYPDGHEAHMRMIEVSIP